MSFEQVTVHPRVERINGVDQTVWYHTNPDAAKSFEELRYEHLAGPTVIRGTPSITSAGGDRQGIFGVVTTPVAGIASTPAPKAASKAASSQDMTDAPQINAISVAKHTVEHACEYKSENNRHRVKSHRAALVIALLKDLGATVMGGSMSDDGVLTSIYQSNLFRVIPSEKVLHAHSKAWGPGKIQISVSTLQTIARDACIYAFNSDAKSEFKKKQAAYMQRVTTNDRSLDHTALDYCHTQRACLLTNTTSCDYEVTTDYNLDTKPQFVILSAAGLNCSYGGGRALSLEAKTAAVYRMWSVIFRAAKATKCQIVSLIGIGLGAFAGSPDVPPIYFSQLQKVLAEQKSSTVQLVFYNPAAGWPALKAYEESQTRQFGGMYGQILLTTHGKDVLHLGAVLAAAQYNVGILNASDADVVFGFNDFGEYWREGHIAGEEEYGMFTTGVLTGSRGLNPSLYERVRM
jgi:hypothetical protein